MAVKLTSLIAPSFYGLYHSIMRHDYTHYWLKGGRGSTKSSFISIMIILLLMQHPGIHAVVFRKVSNTLQDSVYQQLLWAIQSLGVMGDFQVGKSPLSLTYRHNGNKVLFRGLDDPQKIKSIKTETGHIGIAWYEELAEFHGMDEIRNTLQSIMRGGERFWIFYSFNPPESVNSWVNAESVIDRDDRVVHHSTYLTVPRPWLGDNFIYEAEHLERVQPTKYAHQYLGEVTGTGGEIFRNVKAMTMSDVMIAKFDNVRAGLDWGWSIDPLAYVEYHRDTRKRSLYIYHEFYGTGISNERVAAHIVKRNVPTTVIADSAEGKSIAQLRSLGVRIAPCTKGRDSVRCRMRHLTDEIDCIYIDPNRCPNTYREFTGYELQRDRNGNFRGDYPDKDNHTIDAVGYGENDRIQFGAVKGIRTNVY